MMNTLLYIYVQQDTASFSNSIDFQLTSLIYSRWCPSAGQTERYEGKLGDIADQPVHQLYNKGKNTYSVGADIYVYLTIVFPGIGHTALVQSYFLSLTSSGVAAMLDVGTWV